MARLIVLLAAAALASVTLAAADAGSTVPARPAIGDFEPRVRALFDAIVHDAPERAADAFFPRDAFLQVKAMQNPGRYFDKLRARFDQDIHALHRSLGDLSQARFERFELARRGGWVAVGEEGNKLSYWASRHSFLYYRVGDEVKRFEVRVAITWQERWYVIHLSELWLHAAPAARHQATGPGASAAANDLVKLTLDVFPIVQHRGAVLEALEAIDDLVVPRLLDLFGRIHRSTSQLRDQKRALLFGQSERFLQDLEGTRGHRNRV
jgi:hypothetical protein